MNQEANSPTEPSPPAFDLFMDFSKPEPAVPIQPQVAPEISPESIQSHIPAEKIQPMEVVEEQEATSPVAYDLPMQSLEEALLADADIVDMVEELDEVGSPVATIAPDDEPQQDPERQSHPYQAPTVEAQISVAPVAQMDVVVAAEPEMPATVPETIAVEATELKLLAVPHEPKTQDSRTSWHSRKQVIVGLAIVMCLAAAAVLFVRQQPSQTLIETTAEVVAPSPVSLKPAELQRSPVVETVALPPVPMPPEPIQPEPVVVETATPQPTPTEKVVSQVPVKAVKKQAAPKPERQWQDDAIDALDKLEKRL